MKILKKNQIIIFVIALMLVVAGYLNYSNNVDSLVSSEPIDSENYAGIGDAKLVNSDDTIEAKDEVNNIIENTLSENTTTTNETNNTQATSATTSSNDYFVSSRLGRDTMYSQMIESYQKILENSNISQEQKTIATQEITNINNTKNAIMISENLIKTKGFEEVIIFVNDKSVSVIIKADDLSTEQIAQIQNIISRELQAEIDNIHISNK